MERIKNFDGVPITPDYSDNGIDNCYTILTGKNGVGKSRLISNIARKYTTATVSSSKSSFLRDRESILAPKVIAVSTSPFDKFPLQQKKSTLLHENTNYRYVGMRSNGSGAGSSISLISSAMSGFFERILADVGNDDLKSVFDTLGFEYNVKFIFKLNIETESIIKGEVSNQVLIKKPVNFIEELDESDNTKLAMAIMFLDGLSLDKLITQEVDFSARKMIYHSKPVEFSILDCLLILLKFGIAKLMDIKLNKINHGEISLRRASSGEQCMLVMMLGIAGHITDNSLILIDEPEISLHPQWQEDFTHLLIKVFSSYKSCQFIIATHSPQIVSNLDYSFCFITSLTSKSIHPASEYACKSSDFQLAELFDVPGNQNEYITRLAFNLLATIKKQKDVTFEDEQKLSKLLKFLPQLKKTDAVYELILSIEEVFRFYASNK